MAQYIIYKKAEGVFEIVKDNLIFISDSKWSGTQIDGLFTFKSENGARLFANVTFSEVSYVDETGGGSVASFASAISLHNKLKEVGFFDASTTPGSGGADTFKQLADAFSSFTGRDGQVVYINGNVLDSKTIANNEFLSDLGDTNLQTVQNIPSGHILRVVTITEGDQTIQRWSAVPFPTENNIPANGYLELGTVTKIGNEINVSTGFLWIIDGIQLGNTIAYDFTIEDADSGDSRVDIIVAESDGTFSLIQGESSAGSGNAIAPIPNSDQLLLTTVYIYEDAISEPTIPISDGQYVNKVEYQYQGVNATGDGILTDYPLNGINSALDLVSGVTRLNSVLITAAYSLYKGKELAIRNSQLTNVIITDGSGFNFHNGEDFILLPGQVIKLKEYGLEFDFLGTFGGGSSSGVQTVTALNPLAVNNSDPANPILNVATPEYVDQAIADIPSASGTVDLEVVNIAASNLTTLDKTGFLAYANSLNPNVVIPANQILIYVISETQQRFEILKNNTTIGLGQTALVSSDVLDLSKLTLGVPNLTPHSIVFIGDSIMSGFGLTDTSKRYPTVLSNALGYTETNLAIAGTSVKTQSTTIIPTKTSTSKYLVIGYGTNDRAIGGNTAATFQSDLTSFVNAAISKGWANTDIVLVTMPGYQFQTGVADTTIRAYNTSILNVSTNLGTKYLDFYDTMIVNSPYGSVKTKGSVIGNLTADGTHPNVIGNEAHFKIFSNANLIDYIFSVSGKNLIVAGNNEIKNLKLSNFSYKVAGSLLAIDTNGNVYPLIGLPDGLQAEGDIIFASSLIQKDALLENPAYRPKDIALLRGIRIFAGYDNVNHNRIDICEDNGDLNIRNHNSSGNINLYGGTSAVPLLGLQVQKNGKVNVNLGFSMPFSDTVYLEQTAGGTNYGRLTLFDSTGKTNIENSHVSGGYRFYTSNGTSGAKIIQKTIFVSGRELLQQSGTHTDIPSARLAVNSTTEGFLIPRMTAVQRNGISSPATGLQIYNTNTNTIEYFDGTIWTSNYPSNVVSATSTLALTPVSKQMYFTFNGSTSTWTLPAISGNTGLYVTIMNMGTGNITLNSNSGGSDIWDGGTNTVSMNIPAGGTMILYNNSLKYVIQ